jgi:hypothetical protein
MARRVTGLRASSRPSSRCAATHLLSTPPAPARIMRPRPPVPVPSRPEGSARSNVHAPTRAISIALSVCHVCPPPRLWIVAVQDPRSRVLFNELLIRDSSLRSIRMCSRRDRGKTAQVVRNGSR